MALDPRTWLTKAQALKEGVKRRDTHDCGSGKVLLVEHKETGWAAWCHRCNDNGFVPHPAESLAEKLERMTRVKEQEAAIKVTLALPKPIVRDVHDWPVYARLWLYKAGLGNHDIARLGVYYHPPTDRVVLPVLDGTKLVYWQARGFNPDLPKYINPVVNRETLVCKAGEGDILVLTEDILSCWRVAQVTEAWSLLGTRLPTPVLLQIKAKGKPVVVWLDPDGAGIKGTTKVLQRLRLYGIPCTYVESDKDPKLLDKEVIVNELRAHASTIDEAQEVS